MSLKRPRPSLGVRSRRKLCRCGATHGTTILGVVASAARVICKAGRSVVTLFIARHGIRLQRYQGPTVVTSHWGSRLPRQRSTRDLFRDGSPDAVRAIALSSRDTRCRQSGWRRCATAPGRSSRLPARVGEQPPAWCSAAREGARSPPLRKREVPAGMLFPTIADVLLERITALHASANSA